MSTLSAEAAWEQCLDIIQDNISYQKYKSWFEPID
ncbi:DnaA N-terminal domain-containing protein, partial [Fodinibius sp.]